MGILIRSLIERKWAGNAKRDAVRLAKQKLPQGVQVYEGLPYGSDQHPMHTLNLYLPQNAQAPLPTVVDIHGGGWMYGDRELNRAYCMYLASQGYAVMGMSYRLLPETDLKGQIQDIFSSMHWLADHGSSYGFDLSHVLLTGDSAGGHLSALTACIQVSASLQTLYQVSPFPFSLDALAIAHGVCDLYRFNFLSGPLDRAVTTEYLHLLLGRPWKHSPLRGKASFADVASGLPLPPILVISSEPDRYYAQSVRLLEDLNQINLPHTSLHWSAQQGAHLTHVFEVGWWDWPESRETNDKMLAFFRQCWDKDVPPSGSSLLDETIQ